MSPETMRLPSELHDLFGEGPVAIQLAPIDAVDPDFRPVRFGEHEDRVEMFARLLSTSPDEVPPAILVEADGRRLIADGWHRILAAARLAANEVRAIVLPSAAGMSAEQTARLIGARMTARASQPLTKAERKELALALAEDHPDWSDRQIARECGLDHKTVGRLRRQSPTDSERSAPEEAYPGPTVEQAVRQLDRFMVKLRDAAVFNNLTRFRKGTARRLADALADRYGSDAPDVAATVSRYFADAAEALEGEA